MLNIMEFVYESRNGFQEIIYLTIFLKFKFK